MAGIRTRDARLPAVDRLGRAGNRRVARAQLFAARPGRRPQVVPGARRIPPEHHGQVLAGMVRRRRGDGGGDRAQGDAAAAGWLYPVHSRGAAHGPPAGRQLRGSTRMRDPASASLRVRPRLSVFVPAMIVGWQANFGYLERFYSDKLTKANDHFESDKTGNTRSVRNQSFSNAVIRLGDFIGYEFLGGPDDRLIDREWREAPAMVMDDPGVGQRPARGPRRRHAAVARGRHARRLARRRPGPGGHDRHGIAAALVVSPHQPRLLSHRISPWRIAAAAVAYCRATCRARPALWRGRRSRW